MDYKDQTKGGVNRSHNKSIVEKSVFMTGHFLIVMFCCWLITFEGFDKITGAFGLDWTLVDTQRAYILLACAALYWLRHAITLFYLLQRKVEWSEVFGLLSFIALFEVTLTLIGAGVFRSIVIPLSSLDVLAMALLLIGSYLNSASEIQRKWWKQDPANKGHCYTDGLFKYSMHMNYFGDTVLFTGWCLLTYNYWTLALPIFMAASFVGFHIPNLDSYLVERYGNEFRAYAKKTKKFIPFVY
ncbi:DUF1295 domain-containing protein [Agaribacterium sp. ZY112]|uniref:DUF1295 domain-containing protein n=1 Tax=Agaribacterium sp. ZY112 TaxID=3233574 RepID=UPI0035232FF8